MDFAFTEEQELFRRTVRDFSQKVLLPKYTHWDKTGQSAREMRSKLGELGLLGMRIPEKYGGTPSDFISCGIACEEVARADFSIAGILVMHLSGGDLMSTNAPEHLKEQYLPGMARGDFSVPSAITEPHCGSDAAGMTTRAVRDGDYYVITGEKSSISMSSEAAAFFMWAKTDPSAGSRGVSLFVVPADSPGLTMSSFNDIGMKAYRRGALHLDGVRVPAKNMIGKEGQGFYIVMHQFDFGRALLALMGVGVAQQTVEETVEYVKTRTAFGQPVARYQGVAFPIVDAVTMLEASKLMSYKTLWMRDRNLRHGKEAAMAKLLGPRVAFDIIHQMLLLHGHSGYGDDYPIGQRLRDVLGFEIGDGTAQILKLIIARAVLGVEPS